jgi:hypothetical protein
MATRHRRSCASGCARAVPAVVASASITSTPRPAAARPRRARSDLLNLASSCETRTAPRRPPRVERKDRAARAARRAASLPGSRCRSFSGERLARGHAARGHPARADAAARAGRRRRAICMTAATTPDIRTATRRIHVRPRSRRSQTCHTGGRPGTGHSPCRHRPIAGHRRGIGPSGQAERLDRSRRLRRRRPRACPRSDERLNRRAGSTSFCAHRTIAPGMMRTCSM